MIHGGSGRYDQRHSPLEVRSHSRFDAIPSQLRFLRRDSSVLSPHRGTQRLSHVRVPPKEKERKRFPAAINLDSLIALIIRTDGSVNREPAEKRRWRGNLLTKQSKI